MKTDKQKYKEKLFLRAEQKGRKAYETYEAGDYEKLSEIAFYLYKLSESINMMRESTWSIKNNLDNLKRLVDSDSYSKYPSLILCYQGEYYFYTARKIVSILRGFLVHGEDKMWKREEVFFKYCQENYGVVLIFANCLNFEINPFTRTTSHDKEIYPSEIGGLDSGYKVYVENFVRNDGKKFEIGVIESILFRVFTYFHVPDKLRERYPKVVMVAEWFKTQEEWKGKFDQKQLKLLEDRYQDVVKTFNKEK